MRVLNTLNDAKLVHNSSILIGEKDEEEEKEIKNLVAEKGQEVGARTIIEHTIVANLGDSPEDFNLFEIDLEWTLKGLLKFLEEKFELNEDEPHRLRNLKDNRLYHAEEMETKLKAYEGFQEGGTRIQLELGRPTTLAEITISVIMYGKEEDIRAYYFNADITVKEAKQRICQDFAGFDGTKDIQPD